MSLREVQAGRLFDDATTDEQRVRLYVRPGELDLPSRADVELMRRLKDRAAPQRMQIVGPSGAGKTSLIMRVLADLAAARLEPSPQVLVLRVGDDPESLASSTAVMKLVLGTIEAQKYQFSNVDPKVLQEAGADTVNETPAHATHQIGISPPLASYTAQIEETFKQFSQGDNPARVRQNLQDVLATVIQAGHRPVLVLDDTEKFVTAGGDEGVDAEAISNLYNHGVRALAELAVDLVIAAHPRFEQIGQVAEVTGRFAIERIDCPQLPPESEPAALAEILARRLEHGGVTADLETVIEPAAVAALQVVYHDRDSNLRAALTAAHEAVDHALMRGAATVEARDVRSILAQRSR
jgi:type II secretory pathway predicted ATPase ExeA